MRIHALINYSVADLGTIGDWAKEKGYSIRTTHVSTERKFSEIDSFDMLIILGGIMGAYEESQYPWLIEEKEFILRAIRSEKMVLGICLGAQMIADVLGGKAYPHEHYEIGWWEVRFDEKINRIPLFKNLPRKVTFFQYHGDTYELPGDAEWLAGSDGCKNQAFLYGDRVIGLQFHPEFSEKKLQEIVKLNGDEIKEGTYSQLPDQFLGQEEYALKAKQFLFQLLDNMEETYKHI
ncbi:type 1 glutamine amidotransferase [Virgibacillus sp. W0181]|uniref:type 1 glutamine amidotransferase n=1 Tax=Virgibacillus sp. W0181 TaxID=3391581 RepID=UPI003F4686B9